MKIKIIITVFIVTILCLSATLIPASAVTHTVGDVDGDGKISIMDATAIQKKLAGLTVKYYSQYADFDRSGTINILDATAIQKYCAGTITIYGNYIISFDGQTASVIKYFGSETNITVPGFLSGYNRNIESISSNAFTDNKTLKTVTISATVKKIDDYAFQNCSSLTTIYSYNKNLKWGNSFFNCPKFQSIKFL